jgi:CRISPR-associated protein Cas1
MIERITNPETLQRAWVEIRRRAKSEGPAGMDALRFEIDASARLRAIALAVRQGHYTPGPLRRVHLPVGRGRTRILCIPTLEDRILQSATAAELSRHVDGRMSAASFAYRPGRSVTQALVRTRSLGRRNPWVWEADIRSFFDEVPHGLLLDELPRWVADARLRRVIALWLRSFGPRGLAQGAPISPLLSNLHLDPFDREMEAAGIAHVRYADDFVLLAPDAAALRHAREAAGWAIAARGLALAHAKCREVPPGRRFRFLGKHVVLDARAQRKGGDFCKPMTKVEKSERPFFRLRPVPRLFRWIFGG